jgi:hypothetical protein
MTTLSAEDVRQLKTEHLATLLEQTLLDTVLNVLCRLSERQRPLPICYKTDCPMRDDIPF